MEVYKFDKCLLDRLEELMTVLSWKDDVISAEQVRAEWSYFIELQIEPVGWQAIWKMPRVICEYLNIRYPTVVFGIVEQVLYTDLKAIFVVEAVQDDDVHIPERHEVALEDLFPTVVQENSELNTERTADCLDRLRFFYTHIWMPWDNEDEAVNWVEKHLESRIRFCYDMRKHTMMRPLIAHIRSLLTEAKYLQQRREHLEHGLSDEEVEELEETQVTELMRLHLRLAVIRNEIELFENPEMRRIYEDINYKESNGLKNAKKSEKKNKDVFIVILPTNIERHMQLLNIINQDVSRESVIQIFSSLQDALNNCNCVYSIYLSPGLHNIKFLEDLNDQGSIVGICDKKQKLDGGDTFSRDKTIIASIDTDSILFVFEGSFKLENVVLDCRNVCTGIVIKSGTVHLTNCHLFGNGKSSTQQGIICYGGATVVVTDCKLEKFATGITAVENTVLHFNHSLVTECHIGLDLSVNAKAHFENIKITKAVMSGIYVESKTKPQKAFTQKSLEDINQIEELLCKTLTWNGNCKFSDCKANILVLNKYKSSDSGTNICNDRICELLDFLD